MPRAFLYRLLAVNAGLAVAGAVYAARQNIPAQAAVPILAAFLLQISFYLVPGFPEARRRLEQRFAPALLAALAVGGALAPYLLYSLATGVFRFSALGKLAAVCVVVAFTFVVRPARGPRLTWQDVVVLGAVAVALLGGLWRQIYLSPVKGLRLEVLGQIMMIGLGATAFLSLRGLQGTGFQWPIQVGDCKTGIKQFVFCGLIGLPLALGIGFVHWRPVEAGAWMYPFLAAGTFLGMYAVVALFEELFFRGILQNLVAASLGRPVAAQAITSLVFGLCHLPFREFPNWRFAMVATVTGWFYGQAYRERGSIVAAAITHALVVTAWRLLFAA
ncbi:MAG: CPBP family intramembrane metalloprotease [Acidobacteria bacterium]|nr:CPBP family intramembrane metalloprotease [Acidobacteriota bacterium]